LRVCYWDIETHDLKPQFGPLLCASVLDNSSGKMTSFSMGEYRKLGLAEDMTDDRALLVALRDYLETFHITSGYYSKGFDLTHIRSRLVLHNERPFKKMLHIDPIWYFKGWRGLRPMSAKMKHVAEYLKLESKPDVSPEVWMKAKAGNEKALKEVVKRCEADVRITKQIAEKAAELDLMANIQRY